MIPLPIESLFRSDVDLAEPYDRTTEGSNQVGASTEIGGRVERYHQIEIPKTLEDARDPAHLALIVYDMQVGVVRQLDDGLRGHRPRRPRAGRARGQVSASTSPAT